jgi:CheY-like chemotaxis protein
VEVKSQPGQGTVFRVYFPAEEQAKDAAPDESEVQNEDWRGYGIALIADDEEAIRDITGTMLRRLGFEVITAADGQKAVELYTEHAEEITFMLMDINMPVLNGVEATLRIRHINPKLPVLFMSGYPREEVMDRFEHQAHTEFIKKPFESTSLTAMIRSVIEARQG